MKIKFVDLDNHEGVVIIPNFMLEQLGFPDAFYLELSNKKITLTPITKNIASSLLFKICKIKLSFFKFKRQNKLCYFKNK